MASSDIKIVSGLLIGSAVALMTLFNVTDPTRSVASILLVFLMIYIFVSCLMYLSLLLGGYLASRLTGGRVGGRSNRVRTYYLSCALAFVPVCLLAMQSLNQLRALDLVLVGSLTLIIIFYIIKRT
jgi:choline-glycine betaine transporter